MNNFIGTATNFQQLPNGDIKLQEMDFGRRIRTVHEAGNYMVWHLMGGNAYQGLSGTEYVTTRLWLVRVTRNSDAHKSTWPLRAAFIRDVEPGRFRKREEVLLIEEANNLCAPKAQEGNYDRPAIQPTRA